MVAKYSPKIPNIFDFVFSLQNCLGSFKCFVGDSFVTKWDMCLSGAFLVLLNGPKPLLTIVPKFGENH